MVTRWKPRKEALEATRPAGKEDYEKLAQAVLVAIINRQRDIVMRFPYFVGLCESFPKGVCVKKDSLHNYYRAKVWRLANWLYDKGHLPADYKNIMKSMRELAYLEGRVDKMLDSDIASGVECRIQILEEDSYEGSMAD